MPATKTVSRCVPRTEQGTHVFDICGYSQHRGVGRPITSGRFTVGGYSWVVFFHPDGSSKVKEDHVAVGLALISEKVKVRASYELRLIDQSTGLSVLIVKVAPLVFDSDDGDSSWFSVNTPPRSPFESPTYLRDDRLTLECIVTVIKQPRMPETKPFPGIEVPASDIAGHFAKLLEDKEMVDVTFSVSGTDFPAHKMVLATRSPVFKAELYGPMSDGGTKSIVIKDVQPDVFRALLHFIYTDFLPPLDDLDKDDRTEMIRHLLVAADRYAMERLKIMCQSILCENLHVQNLATTLALAYQHHCDMLKDACIEFMSCSSAMDAVAATEPYKNLKRTCPSVVFEALEKISRFRKA